MDEEAIARFAQDLRGPVIGRDHSEYEEARKLYNAMVDKRPLLIARCADVGGVIAAANFGGENKLPIVSGSITRSGSCGLSSSAREARP
jgi:hypothetical protein